jgi:hypothetical protein
MQNLSTPDKLIAALVDDCLESPGAPVMVAPMMQAARLLYPDEFRDPAPLVTLADAELSQASGGVGYPGFEQLVHQPHS